MRELIAWLKANPDKASFATPGVGSPSHVWGIYFQNNTGTRFQFVPYRGGCACAPGCVVRTDRSDLSPGVGSVAPGAQRQRQSLCNFGQEPLGAGYRHSNRRRGGSTRALHAVLAWSLGAREIRPGKSSPSSIAAAVEAVGDPSVRQRFADIGQEIFPREQQTPEALAALQKAEIEKWWPVIKAANIKGE